MHDCNELIARVNKKDNTKDDWVKLRRDINLFLDEDHPIEEKELFYPLGYLEMVNMICDEE